LKKYIIAVDPGVNGAIVVMSLSGKVISSTKMPETALDVAEVLRPYSGIACCYLEKVGARPGQQGMFTFGKGVGHIEMALLLFEIITITATPKKWQKEFQLGGRGKMTQTEWKNILKAKSQQLFPAVKVTLALADALLIAEYGRRHHITNNKI
jgi:hypothetical protein